MKGEWGTYTASHDTVFIHLVESDIPSRNGLDIITTWWEYPSLSYNFTNARLLTMNMAETDTIRLEGLIVGIEEKISTWKEIKNMFME